MIIFFKKNWIGSNYICSF